VSPPSRDRPRRARHALTGTAQLGAAEEAYLAELVTRLGSVLGASLAGVWLVGSGARGDYLPGRSDLDVVVAVSRRATRAEKDAIVARCRHAALPCPARGLELVVYQPAAAPAYELNLNDGPGMALHVSRRAGDDAAHWFVLDLVSALAASRPLVGPPFAEVFAAPGPDAVRRALRDVLAWQEREEPGSANTVLSACRAWLWAAEGRWASKGEAAAWARDADPALVDAALALRRTGRGELDRERIHALLARARDAIGSGRGLPGAETPR
jgi:hypothetical protein